MGGSSGKRLSERGAAVIRRGFDRYEHEFLNVTRRAKARFETRDWIGVQCDARDRLELYNGIITTVVADTRSALGEREGDIGVWTEMRAVYSSAILGHPAGEIAETFFNSVTRRIFATIGVNPAIEYVDYRFQRIPVAPQGRPFREYATRESTKAAVCRLLEDHAFAVAYEDLDRDAHLVAGAIARNWETGKAPLPFEYLEVLESVFYRRKGAYLVGRVRGGNRVMPLVLALVHAPGGIAVDAVLLTEDDVSVVFSFTRSYFHVDVVCPTDIIDFLRSLMPIKPIAELYNALGHNKHGKTEFYRHLYRHLGRTAERFEFAPGTRGMVMVVFAMPSYDVVFKVIRDSFSYPKQTTRDEVKRRYRLVFAHDRAGRLVDAQEFEGLTFSKDRFVNELLQELLETASHSVRLEGDKVVIAHLYTERRVRPLNLFLREVDDNAAQRAALDYGQAIRDLAATNIFPGDFLLKNFGVTRHGRVIFYDYDELSLLSGCRFREIPEAQHPEDELAEEPWFGVGAHDIFPEELIRFLPFAEGVRNAFLESHGCLFEPNFWLDLQQQNSAGEVLDIFPYRDERRLRRTRPR